MTNRLFTQIPSTPAGAASDRLAELAELVARAFVALAEIDDRALAGLFDCHPDRITHLKAHPAEATIAECGVFQRILVEKHRIVGSPTAHLIAGDMSRMQYRQR